MYISLALSRSLSRVLTALFFYFFYRKFEIHARVQDLLHKRKKYILMYMYMYIYIACSITALVCSD